MPGPISESYRPYPPLEVRAWWARLRGQGIRYFVLKASDVFTYLSREDVEIFDELLTKIELRRLDDGKDASHSYWVFARHWPGASRIKSLMEEIFGHPVGGPY